MKIEPIKNYNRIIQPPPDKSIMQRAVVFGFLRGGVIIENPSFCADAISSIECVQSLGGQAFMDGAKLVIVRGERDKNEQKDFVLDAGNSATAARLLAAGAAGLGVKCRIVGDKSLCSRSFRQVLDVLSLFGAKIESDGHPPLSVLPSALNSATVLVSPPSAQVKSAAILTALFAGSGQKSEVYETFKTRDHTEKMLAAFGAYLSVEDGEFCVCGKTVKRKITVNSGFFDREQTNLSPINLRIVGDFSSAAFAVALALITQNGRVAIKNVGLNPTRLGMLDVLKGAGANIIIDVLGSEQGEEFGNIFVQNSSFDGFNIDENNLQTLIDEVPILAVCACFARSKSVFSGLSALKNKESNRILGIFEGLKALGARVSKHGDNLEFLGGGLDKNARLDIASNDHRIVMALSVAAAVSGGGRVQNEDAVKVSYPTFFEDVLH